MRLNTIHDAPTYADVLLTSPTFADADGVDVDALIADAVKFYGDDDSADADNVGDVIDAVNDDDDSAVNDDDAETTTPKRRRRRRAPKVDEWAHVRTAFGAKATTYWKRSEGAKRGALKRQERRDAEKLARAHAEQLERDARERALRLEWPCYFDDCTCDECDVVTSDAVREHIDAERLRVQTLRDWQRADSEHRRRATANAWREHYDKIDAYTYGIAERSGNDGVDAVRRYKTTLRRAFADIKGVNDGAKLQRARRHYAMTKGATFSGRVVAEHRLRRDTMSVRERARVGVVVQGDAVPIAYKTWYDANIGNVSADDAPAPTFLPSVYYERRMTRLERGYDVLGNADDMFGALDSANALAAQLERRANATAFVLVWRDAVKSNASVRASVLPA